MTRGLRSPRSVGRGFTLIELMISVALFGLISTGAMSLVISAVRGQTHSAHVDVAQSGLRASMDFLMRDLLSASAGVQPGKLVLGATGALVQPIVVTDGGGGGAATSADWLEVYTMDGSSIATATAAVGPSSASITVDKSTPFATNDLIVLTDLVNGTLMTVGGTSAGVINVSNPNVFPGGVASYAAGSYVIKVRHVTYKVDTAKFGAAGGSANTSALVVDDGTTIQPLAEGVEDLQIALGFDNNLDGNITEVNGAGNDDEWVFNNAADTPPVSLVNLKVVRVTVVVASTAKEQGTFPVRPKAEDRNAAAAADGFFRRVLRTDITVRNFNL